MKTIILTDSTCDMSPERLKTLDIEVIPLTICFGDNVYHDGVDIQKDEFFEKLTTTDLPVHTGQRTPADFEPYFNRRRDEGNRLIYMGLSSVLSGTMQSALMAKEACGYDNIFVVNTLNVTAGLEIMLRYACELRDEGKTRREIVSRVEEIVPKVRIIAVVDTLKYLVKGGRLPKAVGFVGGALGIKPLIAVVDGGVVSTGTARGMQSAFEKMADTIKGEKVRRDMPVILINAYDEKNMLEFRSYLEEQGISYPWRYASAGCVIGTHTGPGRTGLVYVVE